MKKLIALMLVVVLCLVSCGGAEPEPAPQTSLVNRVAAIESELVKLSAKVAGAPDVSAIKSDLSALSSDIEELSRQIGALEEQIEALEEEKQEEEEGDVDPEDAVEVDVKYPSVITIMSAIEPGAEAVLTAPVRVKLENQLAVAIDDIELSARITLHNDTDLSITDVDLTGDIDWYPYGASNFESWDDIELKAEERESYQLLITIKVKNDTLETITSGNIRVTFRAECEDYEVAR